MPLFLEARVKNLQTIWFAFWEINLLKENSLSMHLFKLAFMVKNLHFLTLSYFLPGEVLASVQGNNEVGLWNMESQFRQLVLWASSSPLLSTNQSNSQSVTAMQSIHNHEMNVLITGNYLIY